MLVSVPPKVSISKLMGV
ncbi:hypothetical protein [uncultured Aquimarina sp.]|nr:hypothetical protein [uncultured Aquimarina sp.]